MKTRVSVITIIFCLILTSMSVFASIGCEKGSGKVIEQDTILQGFSKVLIDLSANVYITQGATESVRIETDDNIMKWITTKVYSNELHISLEKPICPTKFNIFIKLKDISGFALNGSGNVTAKNPILAKNLTININGSGSVSLNRIESEDFKSVITGSGNIEIEGIADNCQMGINGSGNIDAQELKTKKCTAGIYGSGNIKVYASQSLTAEIVGNGNIYYKGNPKLAETNVDGTGKVVNMEK